MEIFRKEYGGESIIDLSQDIDEALMDDFNPDLSKVTVDEYGIMEGTFTVTITWTPEE
jgi:hypothetical protein